MFIHEFRGVARVVPQGHGHTPWRKNGWRGVQGWKIIRRVDKFSRWWYPPWKIPGYAPAWITPVFYVQENSYGSFWNDFIVNYNLSSIMRMQEFRIPVNIHMRKDINLGLRIKFLAIHGRWILHRLKHRITYSWL
jgi:hypothetical protein